MGHFEIAFFALTAVVLAVTGAEALYADMGHFGRKAITRAWLFVVLPALALNYLGQGALLIDDAKTMSRALLPADSRLGPVADGAIGHRRNDNRVAGGDHRRIFAGVAGRSARLSAAVARNAHVSGAGGADIHAVDQQPAHGRSPHPGARVPKLGTLAYAYGMAVTGTITITLLLFLYYARTRWGAPLWLVTIGGGILLLIDLLFVAANLTKLVHGAWLPLLIGIVAFTVMTTWQRGRQIVTAAREEAEGPLGEFIDEIRDCRTAIGARARHGGVPQPRKRDRAPGNADDAWSTLTCSTSTW